MWYVGLLQAYNTPVKSFNSPQIILKVFFHNCVFHNKTHLGAADQSSSQTLFYAPYRWELRSNNKIHKSKDLLQSRRDAMTNEVTGTHY